MRVLYLIFSHDHTEQLLRLVAAIHQLSPDALIAIHHDPTQFTVDVSLFPSIKNIYIIPDPIRGEWGDYSQIEQFLHAIKRCEANLDFDWLITLSGLSYPIKPLQEFELTLEHSKYDAYIHYFDAFDQKAWPIGTAETRFHYSYFKLPKFPYYYKIPNTIQAWLVRLRVWLNKNQKLFRIVPMPRKGKTRFGICGPKKSFGPNFTLCGGRNILNLNRKSVLRLLEFDKKNPEFKSYFKRAICPDETYFTSIIANDPQLHVCNDVLRYIKWPKPHAASAGVIEIGELDEVLHSGAPFALKFDSRVDSAVLDKIDVILGLAPSTERIRSDNLNSQAMTDSEIGNVT